MSQMSETGKNNFTTKKHVKLYHESVHLAQLVVVRFAASKIARGPTSLVLAEKDEMMKHM